MERTIEEIEYFIKNIQKRKKDSEYKIQSLRGEIDLLNEVENDLLRLKDFAEEEIEEIKEADIPGFDKGDWIPNESR